jgi:hypothetical protein
LNVHYGMRIRNFKFGQYTTLQLSLAAFVCIFILAWRFLLTNADTSAAIIREWGYWSMLVLCGWAVVACWRAWHKRMRWIEFVRRHRAGLVLAFFGAIFFQLHEPKQFKVLFDEFGFSGIGYDMHNLREASFPARAHYLEGRLYILNHGVDKRPVLFPFFISLVHDLTGYRPGNVFLLNGIMGAILLFGVYLLAVQWGTREGGWIAQLLLIGFPLIAQNATGGGYDLTNLTFLCLFAIAGTAYMRSAGSRGLDAFVCVTVLLAQLRYESVMYTLACAALIGLKWWRTRIVRFTWSAAVLPVFLLLPLLVNMVSSSRPGYFENKAGQAFFSCSYISDNIAHAIYYLFRIDINATNSPIISYIGILALVAISVRLGRLRLTKARVARELLVLMTMGVICFGNNILMISCFWGNWDDPMVSRFSLPFYFLLLLCIIWSVGTLAKKRVVPRMFFGILAVISLIWSVPASATSTATRNMIVSDEYQMLFRALRAKDPSRTLMLGPGYVGAILYGYPAIPAELANSAPWKIDLALKSHHYNDILVLQRIFINPKDLTLGEDQLAKLSDDFVLETVKEERFRPDVISRVVRVVSVKPEKTEFPSSAPRKKPPFANSYDFILNALEELP